VRRVLALGVTVLGLVAGCWAVLDIGELEAPAPPEDASAPPPPDAAVVVDAPAPPPRPDAEAGIDAGDLPGLMAQWTFEENAGAVSADVTGNGHEAKLANGAAWGPGRVGRGVVLDGAGATLEMPTLSTTGFPRVGTLSVWLKGNFGGTVDGWIFDRTDSTRRHWFARKRDGALLQVAFVDGDAGQIGGVQMPATSDLWMHLVVVWGTQEVVYLDGVEKLKRDLGPWVPSGQSFMFGQRTQSFDGTIDEVRLYNRALTAQEVARVP
jgi:hypothetical protein